MLKGLPLRATGSVPPGPPGTGHITVIQQPPPPPVSNARTVLGPDIQTAEEVTLSLQERLQGLYIIGATGTGKTTLDLNMIISDIYQKNGVCLVEPHGDLTRAVIAAMPEERLKDVIYLDLTDS